ncbi:hypothetical protein RJG79_06230 [Mycoplasmatota bacterium WC44]
MKYVINCETTVDLLRVSNVYNLNYKIDDYKVGDTLDGKIILYGKYVKDNLEEILDYEEEVDFTVDFDEKKYKVSSIECDNLQYDVVFGRGINATYDVVIDYEEPDQEIELIKDMIDEETDGILEEALKNRDDSFLDVEINDIERDVEILEEFIEEEVVEEEVVEEEVVEQELAEEVLLEDVEVNKQPVTKSILEASRKQFKEEDEKESVEKIEINKINIRDNDEHFLGNLEETYSTYKVIFNVNEKNVEELARKYNKSVEEIYKDNNYSINKNLLIKDDSKK